jgi:methylenetetrahydrofolate reductase (NADPH)
LDGLSAVAVRVAANTAAVRISEKLGTRRPFFSFEFFPPRDDAAEQNLFRTIETLKPLDPGFVSITYGAGGSTRVRTVEIASCARC